MDLSASWGVVMVSRLQEKVTSVTISSKKRSRFVFFILGIYKKIRLKYNAGIRFLFGVCIPDLLQKLKSDRKRVKRY